MRVLVIYFLFLFYFAECKTNSKSLTESLGQEVIEIGAPVKELPAELEEEPSIENDEDNMTSTTIQVATKKDIAKKTMGRAKDEKSKDIDKIDGVKQEDEETRIEKELAEIYKDSSDYKADSAEAFKDNNSTEHSTVTEEKPVARMRTNFKFQPNANDPEEVEKFRTSVDDISCEKTKLSGTVRNTGSYSGPGIFPVRFMDMNMLPGIFFSMFLGALPVGNLIGN